jgi:transposase-like protein
VDQSTGVQQGKYSLNFQAAGLILVDTLRRTIDFLLTDRRNAAAAKRFFRRALRNDNSMPRVINVDKNPAYPRAMTELKADGTICLAFRGVFAEEIAVVDWLR